MKDNKLIAEFMGWELQDYPTDRWYGSYREPNGKLHRNTDTEPLLFHASWDWLMPVVDKIEGLGYWVNRNDGDVTITDESDIIVITPMSSGGIDMMYKAVVEFIKQYNDGQ